MKRLFLLLTLIGFLLPNYFVLLESIETGNILLYADPFATFKGMFANRISSIFAIDLLFAVVVFFIWSYYDSKIQAVKHLYWIWFATLLFGLAGGFPLYLYCRELSPNYSK